MNTQFTSIQKPSRINIYVVSKYYKIHWHQHIHSLQALKNPVESTYTQFPSIIRFIGINIYSIYKYSEPQLNQHTQFTSIQKPSRINIQSLQVYQTPVVSTHIVSSIQNPVESAYTQFTSIIKPNRINIYIVCKYYKIHWNQHIHSLQAL